MIVPVLFTPYTWTAPIHLTYLYPISPTPLRFFPSNSFPPHITCQALVTPTSFPPNLPPDITLKTPCPFLTQHNYYFTLHFINNFQLH